MSKPIISPPELHQLLGQSDFLLVDCRHDLFRTEKGREDHLAGHLPGAHHLHLDEDLSGTIVPGRTGRHPLPEMQKFLLLLAALGVTPTTRVVAYDDKGGAIAARFWWMLRAVGHAHVRVLDGGLPAWVNAGYPLETGPVERPRPAPLYPAPTTFPGTRDRAQIDRLPKGDVLVDSRTAPRYHGEHEPIDPVAGHIPGAINLPWPDNLVNGTFKDREQLKIRFAALHDEADHNVFYCGSGVTACHNLLAYAYAYDTMPELYPGSWSEWIIG